MLFGRKCKVRIKNLGKELEAKSGTNLYRFLKENGIMPETLCTGEGQCGRCRVKLEGANIPKPSKSDTLTISRMNLDKGYRLACQHKINSDMDVDTSDVSLPYVTDTSLGVLRVKKRADAPQEPKTPEVPAEAPLKETEPERIPPVLTIEEPLPEKPKVDWFTKAAEESASSPLSADEREAISAVIPAEEPEPAPVAEEPEEEMQDNITPLHPAPQVEEPVEPVQAEEVEQPEEQQPCSVIEEVELELRPETVRITIPEKPAAPAANTDNFCTAGTPLEITDGILLVPKMGGVELFNYSAAIRTLASCEEYATEADLSELVREESVGAFIRETLDKPDTERAVVMLFDPEEMDETLMGCVSYATRCSEGLRYEVIRPAQNPWDIISFLRVLNVTPGKKLLIQLDHLDKVYYTAGKSITELRLGGAAPFASLSEFFPRHKNAVVGVGKDLKEITLEDKFLPGDSCSLSAALQAVNNLRAHKLLTPALKFLSTDEMLAANVPTDLLVRIMDRGGHRGLYLQRSRDCDIILTDTMVDAIQAVRMMLLSVIAYVEQEVGSVESVILYTTEEEKGLVSQALALGMIPDTYRDTTRHSWENPIPLALALFSDVDAKSYIDAKFSSHKLINLADSPLFRDISGKVRRMYVRD